MPMIIWTEWISHHIYTTAHVIIDGPCHMQICQNAVQSFEAGIKSHETIMYLSNQIYEQNCNSIVDHAEKLKDLPSYWSGCQKVLPSLGSGLRSVHSNLPPSGGLLLGLPPSGRSPE
eukprot:2399836-Karenia_brevis.AAC.1